MPKTRKEIEKLKDNWKSDPCWDLYETEGFEAHRDELFQFQRGMEEVWLEESVAHNRRLNDEVQGLGLLGIYKIVKHQEQLLEKHARAIELLADNKMHQAYRVLMGYEE